MKVYFIRHGKTYATEQGLIQGSANNEDLNVVTPEVLLELQESSKKLAKELASVQRGNVYLYSGEQMRCLQTTGIVSGVLMSRGVLENSHIITDARLNGRSYGELEGLREAEVKSLPYIISHPRKAVSYALAEVGFENPTEIEPKDEYADKVFSAIYEIVMNHGKDDVVIISSTSDVYKIMQKDEGIHSMCYFGGEEVPYLTSTKQPFSKETIGCGEIKLIEMGTPAFNPETGKMTPVWESLALRDFYDRVRSSEK